jgi:hypothetical protein
MATACTTYQEPPLERLNTQARPTPTISQIEDQRIEEGQQEATINKSGAHLPHEAEAFTGAQQSTGEAFPTGAEAEAEGNVNSSNSVGSFEPWPATMERLQGCWG